MVLLHAYKKKTQKAPRKEVKSARKRMKEVSVMKKVPGKSLKSILAKELKDGEFRIAYDKKRFYLEVAHLVSELRGKAGLSQAEVAKKAGVSQPMIARLEAGDDRRTPTLDTIYKILRVLGYTFTLDVKRLNKVA